MSTPVDVLNGIARAIDASGKMPASISYPTQYTIKEIGNDHTMDNIPLPLIEQQITSSIRSDPHNTNFVGYAEDVNGNYIGWLFDAEFEMTVQVDVWTAAGASEDEFDLGSRVEAALRKHDSREYSAPLVDGNGNNLDVTQFLITVSEPASDMTHAPVLRRWRLSLRVSFYERIDTSQEYGAEQFVATVDSPDSTTVSAGTDPNGAEIELKLV